MIRFILVFFIISITLPANAQDPSILLKNMKPSWKKVKDYTAETHVQQRVGQKLYSVQISYFKFRKPMSMYAKRLNQPNQNAEAIYQGKDWNKGKIKACKGSFPNITLSLSPYSKLAMIGQNHPMPHFPLKYFINRMLEDLQNTEQAGFNAELTTNGSDTIDGRSCTRVQFVTDAKAGLEYTPKKGDTWTSIAKVTGSDWSILRHQNQGKKPGSPKNTIFAPTYYASKWQICVDDATGLPIAFQNWDHQGNLFEVYEFHKFQINVGLQDIDFDPKNTSYNF